MLGLVWRRASQPTWYSRDSLCSGTPGPSGQSSTVRNFAHCVVFCNQLISQQDIYCDFLMWCCSMCVYSTENVSCLSPVYPINTSVHFNKVCTSKNTYVPSCTLMVPAFFRSINLLFHILSPDSLISPPPPTIFPHI